MTELYDVAIIGGGPVGMFTAFYAGLRDTKAVLVESLATLGGQVTSLYPEKKILDVAGFTGIKGSALIDSLDEQMKLFPIDIKTSTTVTNVTKTNDLFTVTINNGSSFQAKTIIITTGKGSFEPRKMQVSGVDQLVGQGIHYFVTNKHDFDNHDVATMLNEFTHSTRIIHRRDQFRAMEQSVKQLSQSSVIKETPKKVSQIEKQSDGKLKITLAQVKNDQVTNDICVDDLIINYGFISENKIVHGWDIQPENEGQAFSVDQAMQTTIPGVFGIWAASPKEG